jgi:hypothetical protein
VIHMLFSYSSHTCIHTFIYFLFNLTVARTMWKVLSFNSLPYTDETMLNIINCHRLLHVAKINYIFDNKAKHTLNPANRHGPMNGHKLESFS